MTYDEIFQQYYSLYRVEFETPDVTDDEYLTGIRLANEAISRWANYDGTYWKELFATATLSSVTNQQTYACPTDMAEAGGYINLGMTRIPIVDPQDAQFRGRQGNFAYFTGNPTLGFTLNFNRTVNVDGVNNITFVYYRKPTTFVTGSDTTEMANPYFIVHRMLAMQLRGSRNYSGYQTALRDSEEALKNMQLDNNSGTWANPWSLSDNSGTVFGVDNRSYWSW